MEMNDHSNDSLTCKLETLNVDDGAIDWDDFPIVGNTDITGYQFDEDGHFERSSMCSSIVSRLGNSHHTSISFSNHGMDDLRNSLNNPRRSLKATLWEVLQSRANRFGEICSSSFIQEDHRFALIERFEKFQEVSLESVLQWIPPDNEQLTKYLQEQTTNSEELEQHERQHVVYNDNYFENAKYRALKFNSITSHDMFQAGKRLGLLPHMLKMKGPRRGRAPPRPQDYLRSVPYGRRASSGGRIHKQDGQEVPFNGIRLNGDFLLPVEISLKNVNVTDVGDRSKVSGGSVRVNVSEQAMAQQNGFSQVISNRKCVGCLLRQLLSSHDCLG